MSTTQEETQLEQEYRQETLIPETQLLERPINIINGLHEASHAGMIPNMMDAIEIAHQSDSSFKIEVKTIDPPREKESNDGKAAIVAAICGIDRTCADKCCELGNIPKAQIRVNLINELKLNDPDFFNRPDASKIIRARVDEIASQQEMSEKPKEIQSTEPVQATEIKPKKAQSSVAPAWAKTFTPEELEERKKQLEGTYSQGKKISDPEVTETPSDKKSEQTVLNDIKPIENTKPASTENPVQIINKPTVNSNAQTEQRVIPEHIKRIAQHTKNDASVVEPPQPQKKIGNGSSPSPSHNESPIFQQPEALFGTSIERNTVETQVTNHPQQEFVQTPQSKPEIKKPSVRVEQNIASSFDVPIVRPDERYANPQTKLNSLDFVFPMPHIETPTISSEPVAPSIQVPLQSETINQNSQTKVDKIISQNQPEYMQIPVITTDQGSDNTKTLHINIDSQHIPQTVVQSMEQTIIIPKLEIPNINLEQKIYSSFEEKPSVDQLEPVEESGVMESPTVLSIKIDKDQESNSITNEKIKSINISTHIATVISNGSTETLFSSGETQIETAPLISDHLETVITDQEDLEENAPLTRPESTTTNSESLHESTIESSIVFDLIQIPDSNENNTVMIDTTNQNEQTDSSELNKESNSTSFIPLELADAIKFFTELVDVKTTTEPSPTSDEQLPKIKPDVADTTESEIHLAPIEPTIITIESDQESLVQVIEQTVAKQNIPPVMVFALPEIDFEEYTVPELIDNSDNTEFEFEDNNRIESFAFFLLHHDEVFQFMFLIEDISSLLSFLHKYSSEEKNSDDSIEIQDIEVADEELKNDTFGHYDDTVVMTIWPIVQFMLYIQNLQIYIPNQQVN